MGRETYSTGNGVKEVAGNGTTVVVATLVAIIQLCRRQVAVVVIRMVLVAEETFLPVYIWVQVTVMLCIAMTKPGGGEALAVIINDHSAKHNLVASIPVDIHDGIVMVTLSIPR